MMTDAQALGIMAAILYRLNNATTPTDAARLAGEVFTAAKRLHAAETAAPRRHSNYGVGEPEETDGA